MVRLPVVSVKVPGWVKEKMKAYSGVVDWPEEVRRMIIAKIEEVEREQAINKVVEILSSLPRTPSGTAKALVREDRDSH